MNILKRVAHRVGRGWWARVCGGKARSGHISEEGPRWVQMVGEDVEWEDGGARGLLHACKQSGEMSAEEWSRRLRWTYGQGWASKCALERERFEGEFQRSRTMMVFGARGAEGSEGL